jgi:isopropylmalate/homocitrate/citramalate synthase
MGVDFVDSSLQGLGRSSGNVCTEVLVAVLEKMGCDSGIDFLKVLSIGQKYIQPLITFKGRMPLDVVSGYAEFHSSYMHHIQKYSAKYNVDPEILIIEMCKIDKVNVDEEVLEKIAQRVRRSEEVYISKYGFNRYVGGEQDNKK